MNKFYFSFIWFLLLPILSSAQPKSINLNDIELMHSNCLIEKPIQPKEIPKDSWVIRFDELGEIYNPTFPNTRNKVYTSTYRKEGNEILYFSKSMSTQRATIYMESGVGRYYLLMNGDKGFSMIRYDVEEIGTNYKVTGMLYRKCSEAKRL